MLGSALALGAIGLLAELKVLSTVPFILIMGFYGMCESSGIKLNTNNLKVFLAL